MGSTPKYINMFYPRRVLTSILKGVSTGPYYPLGNIGMVPRAYEWMEGRKYTNKEMKK
jgi:hypothetical protein